MKCKRILSLFLLLSLFSGCSGNPSPTSSSGDPNSSPQDTPHESIPNPSTPTPSQEPSLDTGTEVEGPWI